MPKKFFSHYSINQNHTKRALRTPRCSLQGKIIYSNTKDVLCNSICLFSKCDNVIG